MRKIIILLLIIIFWSCSEETASEPETMSYYFGYMFYAQPTLAPASQSNLVTIEYNSNGQVIMRSGGVVDIDPATGFNGMFKSDIHDNIVYSGNQIFIDEGIVPQLTDPLTKAKIVLDAENRMSQRINVRYQIDQQNSLDTIRYVYFPSGLLARSIQGLETSTHFVSDYFYNNQKNLDSIITKRYAILANWSPTLTHTSKEIFSGYDTASNPLKPLFMFKETFLRTLSENNFMHYEKTVFNTDKDIVAHEERDWNIPHNANGEILFDLN